MPQKLLFSTGEVAARLGVARHQLAYRLERGQIPRPRMVGGRRAFTENDLRAIRDFFELRRTSGGGR